MKFLYVTTIFAAAVAAVPISLAPRQVDLTIDAINPLKKSLESLDAALKAVATKKIVTSQAVLAASSGVLKTLTSAANTISGGKHVKLKGAIKLKKPLKDLVRNFENTSRLLTEKKSVLNQLGISPETHKALLKLKKPSDKLNVALVEKVPKLTKGAARKMGRKMTKALDAAIKAYQ